MSAGQYTGDTARLILAVIAAIVLAFALTAALGVLLGPPPPLAVLP